MERIKRMGAPVPYSEIFRLIGAYVDRAHLSEVRVLETEDGIVLQGLQSTGEHTGERATYQLTAEDIEDLLDEAIGKRAKRM